MPVRPVRLSTAQGISMASLAARKHEARRTPRPRARALRFHVPPSENLLERRVGAGKTKPGEKSRPAPAPQRHGTWKRRHLTARSLAVPPSRPRLPSGGGSLRV